MILTGASPVTTFLAVLNLKCSRAPSGGGLVPPCGYQDNWQNLCPSSTNDAGSHGFYRASGILLHAEAVWLFLLPDGGQYNPLVDRKGVLWIVKACIHAFLRPSLRAVTRRFEQVCRKSISRYSWCMARRPLQVARCSTWQTSR